MASLFVIQGRDQGRRFDLESDIVSLGRDNDNVVQLHDSEVSRHHAEVRQTDDGYVLVDLKSSNGTFLGKKRVQWHSLQNGDVFRIGGHEIEYVEHPDLAHNSLSSVV